MAAIFHRKSACNVYRSPTCRLYWSVQRQGDRIFSVSKLFTFNSLCPILFFTHATAKHIYIPSIHSQSHLQHITTIDIVGGSAIGSYIKDLGILFVLRYYIVKNVWAFKMWRLGSESKVATKVKSGIFFFAFSNSKPKYTEFNALFELWWTHFV